MYACSQLAGNKILFQHVDLVKCLSKRHYKHFQCFESLKKQLKGTINTYKFNVLLLQYKNEKKNLWWNSHSIKENPHYADPAEDYTLNKWIYYCSKMLFNLEEGYMAPVFFSYHHMS